MKSFVAAMIVVLSGWNTAMAADASAVISKLKFDDQMTDEQRALAINSFAVLLQGKCQALLGNIDEVAEISFSYSEDLKGNADKPADPRFIAYGWDFYLTMGVEFSGDFAGKGYELAYFAIGPSGASPGITYHADEAVVSKACSVPDPSENGAEPYGTGGVPFAPIPELKAAMSH